jgi:hypothetical protein
MKQNITNFFKQFPSDDACLGHLFITRFGHDHKCEKCNQETNWSRIKKIKTYSCQWCGDIITEVVPNRQNHSLLPEIVENIEHGSEIHTDELPTYKILSDTVDYTHKTVDHSKNCSTAIHELPYTKKFAIENCQNCSVPDSLNPSSCAVLTGITSCSAS